MPNSTRLQEHASSIACYTPFQLQSCRILSMGAVAIPFGLRHRMTVTLQRDGSHGWLPQRGHVAPQSVASRHGSPYTQPAFQRTRDTTSSLTLDLDGADTPHGIGSAMVFLITRELVPHVLFHAYVAMVLAMVHALPPWGLSPRGWNTCMV